MRKKFFSFLVLVLMSGFFTPFSQSQAVGETLGYSTSIDIYLDVDNPNYINGQMFNWSSATRAYDAQNGNCSGARDFAFSCSFSVYLGVNSFMCTVSDNPLNYIPPYAPGSDTLYGMSTGWYTFKHGFYDDGTGNLLVKMNIIKNGVVLKTWEFDTNYKIGVDVGGPRHGWFSKNELTHPLGYSRLPIDNSKYCDSFNCVFEQGFEADANGWFPRTTAGRYPYRVANSESAFLAATGNYYAMASYDSFTSWGDNPASPRNDCSWPTTPTPVRAAEIISPNSGQVISGDLSLEAKLFNDISNDGLAWWVKTGACSDETGAAKIGNVGVAMATPYVWDNKLFTATASTTSWAPGQYCFVFDPQESETETDIRLTRDFSVVDVTKPVVAINNPEDNTTVKGVVNIQASASDANLTRCRLAIKTEINDQVVEVFSQDYNASQCGQISYTWNTDTTASPDGLYSIAFQAFDSSYVSDSDVNNWHEDVHTVTVDNKIIVTPPVDICLRPYDKDDCKKGGWALMGDGYNFKNQGDCVSFLESAFNANGCKY